MPELCRGSRNIKVICGMPGEQKTLKNTIQMHENTKIRDYAGTMPELCRTWTHKNTCWCIFMFLNFMFHVFMFSHLNHVMSRHMFMYFNVFRPLGIWSIRASQHILLRIWPRRLCVNGRLRKRWPGLRISLNFLLHCIANLLANSSVSLVPTLRTRLVRSSKPGPPDVQRSGKGL